MTAVLSPPSGSRSDRLEDQVREVVVERRDTPGTRVEGEIVDSRQRPTVPKDGVGQSVRGRVQVEDSNSAASMSCPSGRRSTRIAAQSWAQRRSWRSSGLIAIVASLACQPSGPASDWSTARETLPSGAVLVTNTPSADASPTLMLVEELRVGSLDGARPESFAALKGLVALSGGGFAVLDSQAQEIRVRGRRVTRTTHGRPGEGPGEFVDATGLMLDPRGRIWAADVARACRCSIRSMGSWSPFATNTWCGGLSGRAQRSRPHPEPSMSRQGLSTDAASLRFDDDAVDSIFSAEEDEGGRPDPEDSPGAFYSKGLGAGTV